MARPTAKARDEAIDLRSQARAHTASAIKVLAGVMGSAKANESARVAAANSLLDRGWGKAPQQLTGADGGDIQIVIRQIIENVGLSPEPEQIEHDDATGQSDV